MAEKEEIAVGIEEPELTIGINSGFNRKMMMCYRKIIDFSRKLIDSYRKILVSNRKIMVFSRNFRGKSPFS